MKKSITAIALLTIGLAFTSCRDQKKETVVKEVEVEKPAEQPKGILERTGEKVDQEVNKEVNEEIDKIGNDE